MNKIKKTKSEIQDEADILLISSLKDIFRENNLSISEHEFNQKREKGIDYLFEVFFRDNNKHFFNFLNQNKGTNKTIKPIKSEQQIPFQLSLKHSEYYYYELNQPVLFTFCDIENNIIYWYCIQNDNSIPNRIQIQKEKKRKSLQIYISPNNILNYENLKKIIKELEKAEVNQLKKKRFFESAKADYSTLQDLYENLHIIDALDQIINLFKQNGLSILPPNVISNIFPQNKKTPSYVSDFDLNTDNEELFNLILDIDVENDKLFLKSKKTFVENQDEKLKTIISFFRVNLIQHIQWKGKSPLSINRVCVHKLYMNNRCDCERCIIERLDLVKANKLLKQKNENYSVFENLRKGYAAYLMEDVETAFEIFHKIYTDANTAQEPISYTVCKYNLIQLNNLGRSWGLNTNKSLEILREFKSFDLSDDKFIEETAPYFVDIYNLLKDEKYFENAFRKIDSILYEIIKISHHDKYGTWHSYNKLNDLLSEFLNIYFFIEYNHLIFNTYNEYRRLSIKILEGMFALYTIKNPDADKYEKFSDTVLRMWIFYIPFEEAKFLMSKYKINTIRISDKSDFFHTLNEWLDNLIASNNILENLTISFKVERILNNIALVISHANFSTVQKNKLFRKILYFSKNSKAKNRISFSAISSILEHTNNISKTNLKAFLDLVIQNGGYGLSILTTVIKYYVEVSTQAEIEKFILKFLKAKEFTEDVIFSKEHRFEALGYAISFLDDNKRENIKAIILSKLSKEFLPEFYSLVSVYDVIEYDKSLFDKFIETVPNMSKLESEWRNVNFNHRLGQVINLIYKYELPIEGDLLELIKKAPVSTQEYYTWLLNLNNYDYSKFNAYWILEFPTKYYLKAFRNSENCMKGIRHSLKENYIEGVAKMYFENLC